MTHEDLDKLCANIRRYKDASDRLERVKAWLIEQRDSMRLATTKAIYQAILDKIEEGGDGT